jgi:predicted PurR-regulated permease PerM
MPKKPSPQDSFKSIQILSAKAQSLWTKAKTRMRQNQQQMRSVRPEPPEQKAKNVMRLDIPSGTVAKATVTVLIVIIIALALYSIRDKLIVLGLAMFIAIVMDTNVRWLERFGVPRPMAVLLLYIAFLSIAVFLLASLIPIVASQLQDIARFVNRSADAFLLDPHIQMPFFSEGMNERLTAMTQDLLQQMGIKDRASALFQFGQNLSAVAQSSIGFAVQVAGSVFNFIVTLILILVLAFFIQLEREKISDFMRSVLPRDYRAYYDVKAEAVYHKISQWFHGQLILCVAIGLLVFVALQILGMPYAQTLALLAGFTEFIPYAGPLIAATPSVLIALSQQGFVWAAVVAVVYYVIQVCENNLLVPLIMKHAVGLSPIAIIFGMLVGVSFPDTVHPVVGIILAVPTTAIITIFVQDFYAFRRRK